MWKQCIPSSWLIKCVFGGVFCQSPVVIPLPGGVARYSPCGVCQEISLWNISLISFGSRISLICIHCSWLDSWLHSDYLLVWHDGVEFFGWNRALTPVYESLDAGVSVFLKIRYRSISFENLIHEYLLGLMIHEYLLRLHANSQFHLELFHFHFPNFQELLYIKFNTSSF